MALRDAALLASQMGMTQWTGSPASLPADILQQVPYPFVKRHLILPVHFDGQRVWVAVSDPSKAGAVEELALLLQRPLTCVYCEEERLSRVIEASFRLRGSEASGPASTNAMGSQASDDQDTDLLEDQDGSPVVRILNRILADAIQEGASDIHLDPSEMGLRVRFRIDGVLRERSSPARELTAPVVTRLKVMAKLDIAEHRLPQDGRIRVRLAGRETDFRISTIPCLGGERLVLRLMDKSHVQLGLQHLHLPPRALQGMKRCLSRAEGLVLVTGPTGSGKTTTLYSAVKDILSGERNLMTIEDPIEVRLPGIAQIQVQPKIGFSFASGLRHILRQDPDVILVGEIRDGETAQIAIQAALTGHLVLSTLHTNDAPSAIARLVDMGVEPYLIGSALLGVLAQRLVRRICPHCQTTASPSRQELQEWEMLDLCKSFRGKGCELCDGTGFSGRLGVYEWMPMSGRLQAKILQTQDAATIKRLAREEGLEPLRDHGLRLIEDGFTTPCEVARVTAPEEDLCPNMPF
jgi:general secretion pathway protein E